MALSNPRIKETGITWEREIIPLLWDSIKEGRKGGREGGRQGRRTQAIKRELPVIN